MVAPNRLGRRLALPLPLVGSAGEASCGGDAGGAMYRRLAMRPGGVREEFLRLHAAIGAVDREANEADDGGGRFVARINGFRPVVFDSPIAANSGFLAAIFTLDGGWEHDGVCGRWPTAVWSVWRYCLRGGAEIVPRRGCVRGGENMRRGLVESPRPYGRGCIGTGRAVSGWAGLDCVGGGSFGCVFEIFRSSFKTYDR